MQSTVTISQLARISGYSQSAISKFAKLPPEQRIPCTRKGRRVFFPRAEATRYLDARRRKGKTAPRIKRAHPMVVAERAHRVSLSPSNARLIGMLSTLTRKAADDIVNQLLRLSLKKL